MGQPWHLVGHCPPLPMPKGPVVQPALLLEVCCLPGDSGPVAASIDSQPRWMICMSENELKLTVVGLL